MRGAIIAQGWPSSSCLQRFTAFPQHRPDPVEACATGLGEAMGHIDYGRFPNFFDYRQLTARNAKQRDLDQADGDQYRASSKCELAQFEVGSWNATVPLQGARAGLCETALRLCVAGVQPSPSQS